MLLQRVCDAKELHPMIAPFDQNSSLSDLIERCEAMYKHSDTSLFKKETTDHIQLGQQDMIASPELDQPTSGELGIGTDLVKFSVNDLNGFNRERDRLINDVLSEDTNADADDIMDSHAKDNEGDIYRSFVEVVSVTNCELLAEASNRNVILKSMNLMKLKNRERGSGVCKFNTLNGRWFGKTEKMSVNIENDMNYSSSNLGAKLIKRGTVVSFNWKEGIFSCI